jgi:hypothetical protein
MKDIDTIQKKLNKLFIERFSMYEGGKGLSVPLIPRLTEAFFKNRIIVVGQETNTWYRETEDDLLKVFNKQSGDIDTICLKDRYDKFVAKTASNYGGNFWRFARGIHKDIFNEPMVTKDGELGHIWLNLFSVEACKNKKDKNGTPTKNRQLAKVILDLQNGLLLDILKLLEPKIVIFLTGHSLDKYITYELKIKDFEFKPIDKNKILWSRELGELSIKDNELSLSNCTFIRAYHPSYFLGYINSNKSIKDRIHRNGNNINNSDYYNSVLLEKIKNAL